MNTLQPDAHQQLINIILREFDDEICASIIRAEHLHDGKVVEVEETQNGICFVVKPNQDIR